MGQGSRIWQQGFWLAGAGVSGGMMMLVLCQKNHQVEPTVTTRMNCCWLLEELLGCTGGKGKQK